MNKLRLAPPFSRGVGGDHHLIAFTTHLGLLYFAEIFLYLYEYQITRPWYGLLILPNQTLNLGADSPYQPLLSQQVQRLYLQDLIPQDRLSPNLSLLKLIVLDPEQTISLGRGGASHNLDPFNYT